MSDRKTIEEMIAAHGVETVVLLGTDPCGVQRGKRLTVPYFRKAMEDGLSFASFIMYTSTVDDVFPGLFDTGIPDVRGAPDLATFRLAPWEPGAAVCIMDWTYPDGTAHPLCPRTELKRQVARLGERGLRELFSLELEFYLFGYAPEEIRRGRWAELETVSRDIHCYSVYEGHHFEPVISRLRQCFPDQVEGCAPEWGQGQFEINLYRSEALAMADTAVLFKLAVKQIAAQNRLSATFMAKWHESYTGSSGHIHHSLLESATGRPMFYDEARPLRMSALFEHFLAGQLQLFRPACLFFAPFANSYKRFQPESFAGTMQTWGVDNRTVTYRVINSSPSRCRLENRVGGADLNPYVAFAACIGAGLLGLDRELPLPPGGAGNCYGATDVAVAPRSLAEAVDAARAAPELKDVLTPAMVDNLIRIAAFEVDVFNSRVTDLERRRYFEMA